MQFNVVVLLHDIQKLGDMVRANFYSHGNIVIYIFFLEVGPFDIWLGFPV